jgi:hypothetical protein
MINAINKVLAKSKIAQIFYEGANITKYPVRVQIKFIILSALNPSKASKSTIP